MSNMSYCRMENTFSDLLDCHNNFEEVYSESERYFREKLYKLCLRVVEEYGDFDLGQIAEEYDDDDWDEDGEYEKL